MEGRKKVATATATASRPQPLPPAKLPRSLLSSVRPSARPSALTDLSVCVGLFRSRSTQRTASLYIVSGDRALYKV